MRTLEVMNQMNERIDKRTDNLEIVRVVEMGEHAGPRTGRITGNEGGWDCCGHCFEAAYSTFRLAPSGASSYRLVTLQEGRYLEHELAGYQSLHP